MNLPASAIVRAKVVEIAQGYVGEGRSNAHDQVAKFLELEGLDFADPSGKPYAYCISGLCFCWMKALAVLLGIPFTPANIVQVLRSQIKPILAAHYFAPSALCMDVVHDLQRRSKWLSKQQALAQGVKLLPGTPVFYEFSPGDHHAETVIEHDGGDTFTTVGFNTTSNGQSGMIAIKTRSFDSVMGFGWNL